MQGLFFLLGFNITPDRQKSSILTCRVEEIWGINDPIGVRELTAPVVRPWFRGVGARLL